MCSYFIALATYFLRAKQLPAYAQAKLAGVHGVTHFGGVPVPGVSIVVRSLSDNTAQVVLSSVNGSFSVDKLSPGRYELIAKMDGSGVATVTAGDAAKRREGKGDCGG